VCDLFKEFTSKQQHPTVYPVKVCQPRPSIFSETETNVMQVLSHPKLSRALQALQSKPAAKIFLVSVATVAAPRVYIDYKRNEDAGNESLFYEGFSLFSNFIAPGLLALGTAFALKKVRNPLRLDTTKWIGNDAVYALSQHYAVALKNLGSTLAQHSADARKHAFFTQVLSHLEAKQAFDGHRVQLKPADVKSLAKSIVAIPEKAKAPKKLVETMTALLQSADQICLLPAVANGKALDIQPNHFLTNLSSMSVEFQKAQTPEAVSEFVRKVRFSNNAKTAVSLSIVAGLGFSAQFINRWLTKKRTGQTGFVGTEKFGQQHAPALISTYRTNQNAPVGHSGSSQSQSPIFGGFASNQFLPNIDQLRYVIYPAGIIGKMLASRSLDELRETLIKSAFAYFNLLFIPNLVENAVAYGLAKRHAFSQKPQLEPLTAQSTLWTKINYYYQSVNKAQVRSYEDLNLYAKQYAHKLSTLPTEALHGELSTLIANPQALLPLLRNSQSQAEREKILNTVISKRLYWLKNISVLSGLLYSTLTLGVGLNLLNIYITKQKQKKEDNGLKSQLQFGLA